MTAKVILNPYAGRWLARQKQAEAEESLRSVGIDYDIELTEKPKHGITLAAKAVEAGFNPIIAAGGDGSISEVVNGIMSSRGSSVSKDLPALGILPLGSANDLVVNLGLPRDLDSAAQTISGGFSRLMDLGFLVIDHGPDGRYFDNNAAIGLEPHITLIQQRITKLRGVIRYLAATLRGILDNPQWQLRLTWDDGSYEGMATLVTVGNNPITGGLFYMTPHADPFDGKLTFVHGYMPTRLQILSLLPRTMKPADGSYIEHPSIHEINASWLKIELEQPTPVHADGEILSSSARSIEYRVVPACLPVLLPASS